MKGKKITLQLNYITDSKFELIYNCGALTLRMISTKSKLKKLYGVSPEEVSSAEFFVIKKDNLILVEETLQMNTFVKSWTNKENTLIFKQEEGITIVCSKNNEDDYVALNNKEIINSWDFTFEDFKKKKESNNSKKDEITLLIKNIKNKGKDVGADFFSNF